MKSTIKINIQELKNTIYFLNDKVEDCYKRETTAVVERLIEEIDDAYYEYIKSILYKGDK